MTSQIRHYTLSLGDLMSIYPVKLSEWFPPTDEMYESCYAAVSFTRCLACDKRVRYSKAIGHHSIPWGYGDIWCSEKCLNSDKRPRPDKRRERRMRRRYGKLNLEGYIKINLQTS